MSAIKIKKGDLVKVIAGKDKDKEGKVIAVDHKKGTVTVEGANMITKHTKPKSCKPAGWYRKPGRPNGCFQCNVSAQWKNNKNWI